MTRAEVAAALRAEAEQELPFARREAERHGLRPPSPEEVADACDLLAAVVEATIRAGEKRGGFARGRFVGGVGRDRRGRYFASLAWVSGTVRLPGLGACPVRIGLADRVRVE